MPLHTLARYGQRVGRVFASVTTWRRLVRERGWRRPRTRVYPAKPTIGVRATRPNEYWHIDVTVIRLITGVKVYRKRPVKLSITHKYVRAVSSSLLSFL